MGQKVVSASPVNLSFVFLGEGLLIIYDTTTERIQSGIYGDFPK